MPDTHERRFSQLLFVAVLIMALPALVEFVMMAAETGDRLTQLIMGVVETGAHLVFCAIGLSWSLREGSMLGRVGAIIGLVAALGLLPLEHLDELGNVLFVMVMLTEATGRFLIALALVRRHPSGLAWAGVVHLGVALAITALFVFLRLAEAYGVMADLLPVFLLGLLASAVGPVFLVVGTRGGLAEGTSQPGDLSDAAHGLSFYRLGLVIGLAANILGQLLLLVVGRDRDTLIAVGLLALAGTITSQVLMLIGLTRFRNLPGETGARSLATASWVMVLALTAVAGVMLLLQLAALGDRSFARDLARGMGAVGSVLPGFFAALFLFFALERLARYFERVDLAKKALMMVGWAGGLTLFTLVAHFARGDRALVALFTLAAIIALGFFVTQLVFVFLTLPPLERHMRAEARAGLARSPLARPVEPSPAMTPTPPAPPATEPRHPFARPLDPPG